MDQAVQVFVVRDDEPVRLDVFLARHLPDQSRTSVKRAIVTGHVQIDGEEARKAAQRLQRGTCVSWTPPATIPMVYEPEPIPLAVVFEDESIIVIDKPAGMIVHPVRNVRTGTLVNALLHHVGAPAIGPDASTSVELGLSRDVVRPGIVHRLDMDTSGLLVVAKNDAAHRALQAQFQARTVQRQYSAILWGIPNPPAGTIDAPIGRNPNNRLVQAVNTSGKSAITHYQTRTVFGAATLVHFRLLTGRTHQIRVHAQHMGHPVMGDPAYGGTCISHGPVSARRRAFYGNVFDRLDRQALHAQTLGFVHPVSGQSMAWSSDLPTDMAWTLERLPKDPIT